MAISISVFTLIIILCYIFVLPVKISVFLDKSLSMKLHIKIVVFDINITKPISSFYHPKNILIWHLMFDNLSLITQVFVEISKYLISLFQKKSHTLHIDLRGGFESPDITGFAVGIVEAIKPLIGKNIYIYCFPDMMSPSTSFSFKVQAAVRLYSVFAETILLIFRVPLLKIIKLSVKYSRGEYHVSTT